MQSALEEQIADALTLVFIQAIMAAVVIATFFLAAVGVVSSRMEPLITSLLLTER
jgi:signal peptidase I